MVPLSKGGSFRKWFGNHNYVVNWENGGEELLEYATQLYKSPTRTIKNISFYFREGGTWSTISSSSFSMRYSPKVLFQRPREQFVLQKMKMS
jgi:hypothetical protein